jgi:hypothetical protein
VLICTLPQHLLNHRGIRDSELPRGSSCRRRGNHLVEVLRLKRPYRQKQPLPFPLGKAMLHSATRAGLGKGPAFVCPIARGPEFLASGRLHIRAIPNSTRHVIDASRNKPGQRFAEQTSLTCLRGRSLRPTKSMLCRISKVQGPYRAQVTIISTSSHIPLAKRPKGCINANHPLEIFQTGDSLDR